jgi:dienelactone hydrolase
VPFTPPADYLPRPFSHDTSRGVLERRVFRRADSGPTVILIHEAPCISARTFAVADQLAQRHYTVAVPELMKEGSFGPAALRRAIGFASFCVAHELSAFSTGKTGAIVEWLRALAREEAALNGDRPVAVIGMCFSGGFALGAITDPAVGAAVMSQPALPFPLTKRRARDLGVSPPDLEAIERRIGDGAPLRIMRYTLDSASPKERFDRVVKTFPACARREVPSAKKKDHSVLANSVAPGADHDLRVALDETLAFLDRHLAPRGPSD